jgi:hypothetical protein
VALWFRSLVTSVMMATLPTLAPQPMALAARIAKKMAAQLSRLVVMTRRRSTAMKRLCDHAVGTKALPAQTSTLSCRQAQIQSTMSDA